MTPEKRGTRGGEPVDRMEKDLVERAGGEGDRLEARRAAERRLGGETGDRAERTVRESGASKITPREMAEIRLREPDELAEVAERRRVEGAIRELRGVEELREDRWRDLHPEDRRRAILRAADALTHGCGWAGPPEIRFHAFPEEQGGVTLGEFKGAPDFEARLNEKFLDKDWGTAREAVETLCHEYRHSYQDDMARAHDQHLYAGDVPDRTLRIWREELHRAEPASDEEYLRLQTETDSRRFAAAVCTGLYARS